MNRTEESLAQKPAAQDAKKLLFIVGSLRRNSFNRVLADYAAQVVGDRARVAFLDYADVPFMDEDIEFPAPLAVSRVRDQISSADAVWIFTPEYNYSFPASLKNLLDWLSRPLVARDYVTPLPMAGKPVAVSGAGGKGATAGVRKALFGLLGYLKADIVGGEGEGFVLPISAWTEGVYEVPAPDRERIAVQAEALLAATER